MKYKVGDKVRIRKDLKVNVQYGSTVFTSLMCKHKGEETIITKVLSNFYSLEVDDEMWAWSEEMLEPITECDFKVGDKVIFNPSENNKLTGVFTVSEIDMDLGIPYIKLKEIKECMWLNPDRLLKVPIFKVGQIVQFKDIKNDKWFVKDSMHNLEGEHGVITEVNEKNIRGEMYYRPTVIGQDSCRYRVKSLKTGNEWSVTSASLQLVHTINTIEDVRSISGDDQGPRGDLGVVTTAEAIAQAVDNVKGPRFKIGDKVIIRDDLIPRKIYDEWDYSPENGMGGWRFTAVMAKYMGKVATVIGYWGDDPHYCKLDIDRGDYSWVVNALLHCIPGSDYDLDKLLTNKQKQNNYENRLQEKGPVIAGRERQSGCAVRYPGKQIRVGISNLGYRKVTCKR